MDDRRNMRVLSAVKKDILNRVVIKNQLNLISYLDYFCLDIQEFDLKSGKPLSKAGVINLYNNKFGSEQTWEKSHFTLQRVIQDICWRSDIRGRVLIVGDMNAHSPIWNLYYHQR